MEQLAARLTTPGQPRRLNGRIMKQGFHMKILAIRPAPPGSGKAFAHFDMALTDDVRLYGLRLIETDDGRFLTYAPNSHGQRVATFTPTLANEISRAASAAFREGIPHDHQYS